jgi:DNA-binding beta-propeller fold protein YncE
VRYWKAFVLVAFALVLVSPGIAQGSSGQNALFAVNTATGQLSPIGCVGTGDRVVGLALKDAGTAYAVTNRNELLTFALNNPGMLLSETAVSGLVRGDRLAGIDVRPATGELYALGSRNTIYVIDPATGQATARGGSFGARLSGSAIGFDFNPTVDKIRVVSDRGQNLRLDPVTGQVVSIDKDLAFKVGDVFEGRRPRVSGAGYTNSVAGATSTQLFDIDAGRDVVTLQAPPNDGTLSTIGSLGFNVLTVGGFDILASGPAYAVVRAAGVC